MPRASSRLVCALLLLLQPAVPAAEPPTPLITNIVVNPSGVALRFAPYPSAQAYTIYGSSNAVFFASDPNFSLLPYVRGTLVIGTNAVTKFAYEWRRAGANVPAEFFRVGVTPLASNLVLGATALNRLAYGPTPAELARVIHEGPESWIAEQLSPWSVVEDVSHSHTNVPYIEGRFAAADQFVTATNTSIADIRAWHMLRSVGAKRQLLEILLQFLENHFVTQVDKTREYFAGYYSDSALENRLAAQTEYLEIEKWRAALLNPSCTFYDLLKVSAESPAMIVYLDTVSSRGDGTRVANENYARELLELFTFGVDNGYEQNDITVMSRAWTGWTLDKVDFTNAFNPFSLATTNIIPGSTNTSTTAKANLFGVWALSFRTNWHNTSNKTIFPGRMVPDRFGAPWAGRSYQLSLANGGGTNGMRDGYQVLEHLANQPFTQEYICIKLCRLLVHDDFPNPSIDPARNEYEFYNYATGHLSPEAKLVHDCMLAWEGSEPKGQIWKVLQTIVGSELFRSQGAAQQKVKTPLELVASTVRALRTSTNYSRLYGSFTAFTDGYNLTGTSSTSVTPLTRMGEMSLFNRENPDGYAEAAASWISAGTLAERLRFIQAFCIAPGQSGHTDAGDSKTGCDPVGLLRFSLPGAALLDAAAVTDFFLGLLYPGEGAGNLMLYRDAAIRFLNTSDGGAASPFSALTVSSTPNSTYDNRVRGVVSLLMTMHRFQEQ